MAIRYTGRNTGTKTGTKTGTTTTDGVTIHHESIGDGRDLVLVHGLTDSSPIAERVFAFDQ